MYKYVYRYDINSAQFNLVTFDFYIRWVPFTGRQFSAEQHTNADECNRRSECIWKHVAIYVSQRNLHQFARDINTI